MGVDPGYTDIFTASSVACRTGTQREYKADVEHYSTAQYLQDAGITTANVKIKLWQDADPVWRGIVDGLPPLSCKTTKLETFKVTFAIPSVLGSTCDSVAGGMHAPTSVWGSSPSTT